MQYNEGYIAIRNNAHRAHRMQDKIYQTALEWYNLDSENLQKFMRKEENS